jgi:hypothetical protein
MRMIVRRRYPIALLGVLLGVLLVGTPASLAAVHHTSSTSGAFSASKTVTRTYVENGVSTVVDKRHFSLHVDQTRELRNRQEISVNWSGAHPTGGIAANPNSSFAAQEEYPVVLMMCRGSASSNAPAKDQITPQTCWTATPSERVQDDLTFNFPPYRIDQYASVADRGLSVGVPAKLSKACVAAGAGAGEHHWVPFDAVNGHVFGYGSNGCAGLPPEATFTDATQPSNTTYGVTHLDGRGQTDFVVNTNESNSSLGCSDTVGCALVAVPVMGISCDPAAFGLPLADQPPTPQIEKQAASACETNGNYAPGQLSSGLAGQEQLAVSGELWWSASNWRNRIEVPLTFAPPDDECALVSSQQPQDIYGSPLMTQAALQWAPHFCTDKKLFNFQQIISPEPEAKNLLEQGSIDAAFQAVPPQTAFTKPTVQAPTALTGFAVVYVIDNAKGVQYFHLRLDARLLAKLLTESYPAAASVRDEYPALQNNPLSIASDPEFQALNPGLPAIPQTTESASTIMMLSSDSDTTWALTSYINDNPQARAWLNGKPDPWGMVVNPAYKGDKLTLPTQDFPLQDTFVPSTYYQNNPCLNTQKPPPPYLPLVAAPVESQQLITLDMQFSISDSQVNCIGAGSPGQTIGAIGREPLGQRFIMGVTSLADARRYALPTASLQTAGGPHASAAFTTAAGQTFAGPTDAGLRAGAHELTWDKALGSWVLPYGDLDKTAAGRAAYPGTMLLSTDVPTTGLPKKVAANYSKFLTFAAGPGQDPGSGVGQLPSGFLPMTAANGLGAQVAYTNAAATAVAEQKGQLPDSSGHLNPGKTGHKTSHKPPPGHQHGGSPPGSQTPPTTGSSPPGQQSPPGSKTGTPPSTSPPGTTPSSGPKVITGALAADGVESHALPIALLVLVIGAAGLGGVWLTHRRRAG